MASNQVLTIVDITISSRKIIFESDLPLFVLFSLFRLKSSYIYISFDFLGCDFPQ